MRCDNRTNRPAARATIGLLGTALLSLAAARSEQSLASFDHHATLPRPHRDGGRRVWLAVTALGSRPTAYTAVAAHCILRRYTTASTLDRYWPFVVLAGADAARTALCSAVDRPRPPAHERLAHCQGASFPSRHTSTALLATALATGTGPAIAGAVAAAVGLSRIALRVHWPSDVAGGWLFGYGWLAAAQLARAAAARHQNAASRP
ncbi:phosphatase PAP2 family protein [Streptomyces sp. NPDC048385]|uniref:phosphatase PAP2 family protein n=1 Tax=unclassified Streptomyces TaxID=2593676 RepID=UPI003442EA61